MYVTQYVFGTLGYCSHSVALIDDGNMVPTQKPAFACFSSYFFSCPLDLQLAKDGLFASFSLLLFADAQWGKTDS